MTIVCDVSGELAQMVTCQLDPGQSVFADATKFRWKTVNVSLETRLTTPGGAADTARQQGSGLLRQALATATEVGKRALAGQSLAFQWFRPTGGAGLVAFAGELPGQVRVVELDGASGWYTESRALLCAEGTVDFDVSLTGLDLARRSRQGVILEHFTGTGTLVVGGGGHLVEINPADYGGTLEVHAGGVVGFADSVSFGVQRVGAVNAQTAMTAMFGGGGLSLVTLRGDGPVLLQTTLHREFEEQERDDGRSGGHGLAGPLLGRL